MSSARLVGCGAGRAWAGAGPASGTFSAIRATGSARGEAPLPVIDRALDLTLLGYTRLGYQARRPGPLPPVSRDRVVVVTGATSGLGLATTELLLEAGATVIAVGRSAERLAELGARLASVRDRLQVEQADLARLGEVRALGERLATRPRIDGLVCNAGELLDQRVDTEDGLERTLAVHVVAHWLLVHRLVPKLEASGDGRVVFVSSGGMYGARLDVERLFDPPAPFDGVAAYAQAKRAQIVLAEELAKDLAPRGIVVHSMHPGWADTPGVVRSLPRFHRLTRAWLRTPREGADTIAWLCLAAEARESTGLFWHDRAARPTHRTPWTREAPDARRRLLRRLEAAVPGVSTTP